MSRYFCLLFLRCFYILMFPYLCSAETIILEEVIVKGERVISPEEQLDIKDVRENPVRDAGEALKSVEGINIVRKGAIANDIVIRGFLKDNINVLIDGVRLHGACPNRMDPTSFHVDFEEIKEISILKGPFDVENPGSLGGLINIKTAKPEKGWHTGIKSFLGSWKNFNSSVYASYGGERYEGLMGYSYKYSLPYEDGDGDRITEKYALSSSNRYKDDEIDESAYSINSYWTRHSYSFNTHCRTEISYSRQEADDVIYPYLLMDADYDNSDRLNWTSDFNDLFQMNENIKLQLYLNRVKHDMTDSRRVSSIGFASGYMMRTFAETHTCGANIAVENRFYEGLLSFGFNYYLRNWEAETTLPTGTQDSVPDVDIENMGAYLSYINALEDNLEFKLGTRFDHTESKAGKDRSGLYLVYHGTDNTKITDSYLSGNVQLSYAPMGLFEFFTGAGLSTRPPDATELFFALLKPMINPNWVGNPNLDPVKNREIDLGIKYAGQPFSCRLTFFYSDIKDFITVYDIGPVGFTKTAKSYRNVDATIYGGEMSFSSDLPFHLQLQGGLSFLRGQDETFDKPLTEISPLTGNLSLRYELNQYFGEVEGIFSDDQSRVDKELNEEPTSGWGIINFKAGLKYKKIRILAGIQNIFDKYYYEHLSYMRDPFRSGIRVPEIGRSVYLRLSFIHS